MGKYILAHDLGTSGNKASLYDTTGALGASVLYEYPTYYPDVNCVEQDAEDWWKAVCDSTRQLMEKANVSPEEIIAVSFSAQMMGCLLVDKNGDPLSNMIIWADMRAKAQEQALIDRVGMERVYRITGHRASASYSAAKLFWMRDNRPEVYGRAYKMLHAKDYIIHKLTGKFVTDYSDASGTNLLDLEKKTWSREILDAMEIPEGLLPELHASTDIAGGITAAAAAATGLLEGTPVVIGGGDGSCACVGAGVVREGKTYNVIGSSSWISCATRKPVFDDQMRTFNWVHLDPQYITPCGTMQAAGYSFSWLKNTLCDSEAALAKETGERTYSIIDREIQSAPAGSNKLLYLPYLLGERSPRWNKDARGAFVGLSVTSTKAEILRSVLEGVGYNLKIILDILDKSIPIEEVTVIGGGARSAVWMQILADIWQKPVAVPRYLEEATSIGAAVCAGVGVGAFESFDVIDQINATQTILQPNPENAAIYEKLFAAFDTAYTGLLSTYDELAKI